MKELDEIESIFLADDVDEETRTENAEVVREWKRSLRESETYLHWQQSDITKEISHKAKEAYLAAALRLATDRSITPEIRFKLWAEQDAASWILSLTEQDAKGALAALKNTIASKLDATK
jgi:hypothetical protein